MADLRWAYLDGTFLALGHGFHFSSPPPPDIVDDVHLRSGDPWEVIACILARLQCGQLQAANLLVDLMHRNDSALVWNACAQLVGFAGTHQLLERMASEFSAQFSTRAVQHHVSTALVNGCGLWAIPHLVRMHQIAFDNDARIHLELGLSRLLELEQGPISTGPANIIVENDVPPPFTETSIELDFDRYYELVETRAAELRSVAGPDEAVPIAFGRVFHLESFSRALLHLIRADGLADRIAWGRMAFEATTGVSCHNFYDPDWKLRPLAAATIIDEYFNSDAAKNFEPGVRYFFGHRISG